MILPAQRGVSLSVTFGCFLTLLTHSSGLRPRRRAVRRVRVQVLYTCRVFCRFTRGWYRIHHPCPCIPSRNHFALRILPLSPVFPPPAVQQPGSSVATGQCTEPRRRSRETYYNIFVGRNYRNKCKLLCHEESFVTGCTCTKQLPSRLQASKKEGTKKKRSSQSRSCQICCCYLHMRST